MTRRSGAMVVLALVLVGVAVWGLTRVPTAFLPDEDQGYLIVSAQLPDGASKERTDAVMQQISRTREDCPRRRPCGHRQRRFHARQHGTPRQRRRRLCRPQGLGRRGSSRRDRICARSTSDLNGALQGVTQAIAFALLPPPIQGIGNVGGFSMQVEIRNGDFDYALLQSLTDAVIRDGNAPIGSAEAGHDLPGRRPAAQRHRRPHQGRDARHHGRQCLFRAGGLRRIELRGPVQQVRTRVPGLHAGAARLPRERRATSRTSRSRRATEP